jgi:hypothetical protein
LCFRVAEADVVLEDLGSSLCHHETSEEAADKDVARVAHAIDCSLKDGFVDILVLLGRDDTSRSVSAHTSSVRALVTIEDALVVLSRWQTGNVVTVAEGQDAAFFTDKQLLDDNSVAGRTELAGQHDVLESLHSLFLGLRDDDTLAGSETVSLDDDVVVDAVEVCLCFVVVAKVLVCGSGDVVVLHKVLAEGLATFHTGSGLIGTEALDVRQVLSKVVDNAGNKRGLRTRNQEVDRVVACELDQSSKVVGLDIANVGDLLGETARLRLSMDTGDGMNWLLMRGRTLRYRRCQARRRCGLREAIERASMQEHVRDHRFLPTRRADWESTLCMAVSGGRCKTPPKLLGSCTTAAPPHLRLRAKGPESEVGRQFHDQI